MPNLRRQWTVDDRNALPDDGNRYEVIDGKLFVTPAPTWRHQDAVGRFYRLISEYLDRERIGYAFVAPADVVFSPERGVQPDRFVVPLADGRPPMHFDAVNRLLLAVEVLSPTTARSDRVVKRALYREEHVDEYWIVDLDARTLERSTPSEGRPDILDTRVVWSPAGAANALEIDLTTYFAGLLND